MLVQYGKKLKVNMTRLALILRQGKGHFVAKVQKWHNMPVINYSLILICLKEHINIFRRASGHDQELIQ